MTEPLAEARALLAYIISAAGASWEPSEEECRRYCALLASHGLDKAPVIAPLFLRHSVLLGALDAATRLVHADSPLQRKLRAAAVVVECSPGSAVWLLPRSWSAGALATETARLLGRIALKSTAALPLLSRPVALRRYAGL
jgi:hypothetical protein